MKPSHAASDRATGPAILSALPRWQDRDPSEFPSHAPPCDALGNPAADMVLAAAFLSIARMPDPAKRVAHLQRLIKIHFTRWRGMTIARPARYDELLPHLKMTKVLRRWSLAIEGCPR